MTQMRLSDAIRLGAMMKPQAFNSTEEDGSCALRSAADAVGIGNDKDGILNYSEIEYRFPITLQPHGCPQCTDRRIIHVEDAIWHLNDTHRWTRERIADWVETIENQHAASRPNERGWRGESEVRKLYAVDSLQHDAIPQHDRNASSRSRLGDGCKSAR